MSFEYTAGIVTFTDIEKGVRAIVCRNFYNKDNKDFEDWVNVTCGGYEINGVYYTAYNIVRYTSHDEDALENLLNQYRDIECENDINRAIEQLKQAKDGEDVYIQDKVVHVKEVTCLDEVRAKIAKKRKAEARQRLRDKKQKAELDAILDA